MVLIQILWFENCFSTNDAALHCDMHTKRANSNVSFELYLDLLGLREKTRTLMLMGGRMADGLGLVNAYVYVFTPNKFWLVQVCGVRACSINIFICGDNRNSRQHLKFPDSLSLCAVFHLLSLKMFFNLYFRDWIFGIHTYDVCVCSWLDEKNDLSIRKKNEILRLPRLENNLEA